jgi:putative DNA primase/helicase
MTEDNQTPLPGDRLWLDDLKNLESSWITSELAAQALLRRVDSVEGALVVGRRDKLSNYAGIIFPYVWPGEQMPREYRLRRDQPDLEYDAEGKPRQRSKYVSPPGRGNLLYFAPGTDPALLSDVSVPIAITEGEKKTLALYRLSYEGSAKPRFLPVGLSGVFNWRGKRGMAPAANGEMVPVKGPIPDLDRISWAPRIVYIIFDTSAKDNENVSAARRGLTRELQKRGAVVYIVEIPQIKGVNGIDDFLAVEGAQKGLELLQNAAPARAKLGESPFKVSEKGIHFTDPSGEEQPIFVCSRLDVVCATRNTEGQEWGRLLRITDLDGNVHEWAMPMEMLAGDGSEYRARLLSMGLRVGPGRKPKELLTTYIQSHDPGEGALCVSRVGWHDEDFVLPDESFGAEAGTRILFQSAFGSDTRLRTSGTLDEWRKNIGEKCKGNSRLLFAVTCAFAAPLLSIMNEESGGFHYRGNTSTGKSTVLGAAGSVWGGGGPNGFLRSWRSTANGLESIAESHNDGLLCLDELAQVDAREAGEIAYLLANGAGKIRMTKYTGTRKQMEWRLIYLSAGEISLAEHARTAGKKTRGGQEVRLVDIDANAGKGMGLFEDIHGCQDSNEFARELATASRKYYGTPIREFLRFVAGNKDAIKMSADNFRKKFLADVVPAGASGEVQRVAGRFAIVAAAGELAIAEGILPVGEEEAEHAARVCFQSWLNGRGTSGAMDIETAIRQVRNFLESHGSSRFQDTDAEASSVRIINRAGFKSTDHDTVYFILPETFRTEVCVGYDYRIVAQVLAERGFLETGKDRLTVQKRFPEVDRVWVYAVKSSILEGTPDQNAMVTPMSLVPAA